MELKRFWRHVAMTPSKARAAFPPHVREAIARAVAEGEKLHSGEVRFAVEAELGTLHLLRGHSSRARAIELFGKLGVGKTAERTGVLVYVLLADRKVEIVADRGISAKVDAGEWQAICATMQDAFGAGRFEEGAVAGVRAVTALLGKHFPVGKGDRNELPDAPVML
jgi:uncharacterized membrane protein